MIDLVIALWLTGLVCFLFLVGVFLKVRSDNREDERERRDMERHIKKLEEENF